MKKEWGADLCHNVGGFLSRYETRVFGQMGNHGYYSFIFFSCKVKRVLRIKVCDGLTTVVPLNCFEMATKVN